MPETKTSDQIREEFFQFFQDKEHELVASASLVPANDPTLLFTNAGMNQFKDVFLETGTRPYSRAVDTQKCLRVSGKHNDLEEVGLDTYHHTFFEMLGNWSFGDYFKKEAITWAWELLVDKWGLDPDRLYATVHEGDDALGLSPDDEAAEIWKSETGLDPDHVLYCSSKDNFWMMGDTGPCGPCSEIHVDIRSEEDRKALPGKTLVNADHPLVIEIWNLVFIQYNALGGDKLESLSAKHVDTGMGFERIVAVLQGKQSNYDTDLFLPLLDAVAAASPRDGVNSYNDIDLPPEEKEAARIALRVIADHARTVTFAISDGAAPGNVGQGYVIRRILRRAVRFGYQRLGFRDPFMHDVVPVVVDQMAHVFPELKEAKDYIQKVVKGEEESFLETLGTGISFFERIVPYARSSGDDSDLGSDRATIDFLSKAYGEDDNSKIVNRFLSETKGKTIPGAVAFLLHDTYGFPVDLTRLMAREKGLTVDMDGYTRRMTEQKDRARAAANFVMETGDSTEWTVVAKGKDSEFVGYDMLSTVTSAVRYNSATSGEGDPVHKIIFASTPFYAESGGQVGDTGVAIFDGEEINVIDTIKESASIVHVVDRIPDNIEGRVRLLVDHVRRQRIAKNHTATHLVHAALRRVLGEHVTQKGSLVSPEKLRFDFNHFEKVDREALSEVASIVNEVIQKNIARGEERHVAYDEAIARGATALFGEKYGEYVRMITFDPEYSVELCGGTHVDATGEIGLFRFTGESSVASGIRRIEGVTGMDAVVLVDKGLDELERARHQLKSTRGLDIDIAELQHEAKALQQEVAALKVANSESTVRNAIDAFEDIGGINYATARIDGVEMETLRELGTRARAHLKNSTVLLLAGANSENDKAYLVAAVSDDLTKRLPAGAFVGRVARLIDGGGGGRPELATAGGNSPAKLDDALKESRQIVEELLQPVGN